MKIFPWMRAHRFITILVLIGSLMGTFYATVVREAVGVDPADLGDPRGSAPIITLPYSANPDWWTTVQKDLREAEYHVSWQEHTYLAGVEAAYQAPNRAHNLRTYFTPQGICLIPRQMEGQEPSWGWGLSLSGYGSVGALQPVAEATLEVHENRIEYRRHRLTEWYLNDARGLEQGFTLHEAPSLPGPGLLALELSLSGDLIGHLTDDGTAIELFTRDGVRVLRYGGLEVYDAGGRNLPAGFELTTHTLRIVFDAADAVYPITIDPLATSPSWTAESNQADASFGRAVGTAGDVNGDGYADVIVGAFEYDNGQTDEGRAYVYFGGAAGLDTIPAWTAESNQADAWFGYSVQTAGDVNGDGYADVIVGAPYYSNGQADEGRAFVYLGGATGLGSIPAWTAESNYIDAEFGASVGTAGDVNGDGYADVIIGQDYYTNGQTNEGRASVYHGSATGLDNVPAWTAEGNLAFAYFANSVGTAGDVNGDGYADVIIGAYFYTNDQSFEGRAYVYHGSAPGLSTIPAWMAEGNQAAAGFGSSVGTAGDVNGDGYADVIVGASSYTNGQTNEGRAYVYHGSAAGLSASSTWTAESDQASAGFGSSVGAAGDVNGDGYSDVIVGAPSYTNDQADEGRAYVYYGGASGVQTSFAWTDEGDQLGAAYGCSVLTAGDVNGDGYADVIIGASGYGNGQAGEGRAFVHHGGAGSLSSTPALTVDGGQASAQLGISIASAGDVNGDGYADMVVGAPFYDHGQTDEGRVYLYLGSAGRLSSSPIWTAESDQSNAYFGYSVGTAGDVNGDGFSDVVIGAYHYTNVQPAEGRAYVYHGGGILGLVATPSWTAESDQDGAHFGSSVAAAGDVNGDGYGDVIVGAPDFNEGQTDEGRAYVYHGSVGGLQSSPGWTAESNQVDAHFGSSVGTAGDVNGDGFSDVVVGAYHYTNGQSAEGGAFAYHGGVGGLSNIPAWTAESNQANAFFGRSVGGAGDVNGDGYSDVVIGASAYNNGQVGEGRAYLYPGSVTGLNPSAVWTDEGDQEYAWFGYSVGSAGDVNGDGYSDVVVGAPLFSNGQTNEGRAMVYHGGTGGLSVSPAWTAESDQANAWFGMSVGMAGDVNGDGYSEVVIGAVGYDDSQTDEGRAYIYYGNGGRGLRALPRQLRMDDSVPIDHLGMSDTLTAFRLSLIGGMPLGREDVKLQWQVAPLGVAFDDPSVIQGSSPTWMDTGVGGVEIIQPITGLDPDTPYHWRVRLLYRPGNALGQAASRWYHIPWSGWEETDLRTAGFLELFLPLVARD